MSIIKGAYTARAEIYGRTVSTTDSGAEYEEWDYNNPVDWVDCIVTSFDTESSFAVRSREIIDLRSSENDLLKMKTSAKLSRDDRVGKIKDRKTGALLFLDYDRGPTGEITEESKIYDVIGSFPVTDPFGQVLEQVYTLELAKDL